MHDFPRSEQPTADFWVRPKIADPENPLTSYTMQSNHQDVFKMIQQSLELYQGDLPCRYAMINQRGFTHTVFPAQP